MQDPQAREPDMGPEPSLLWENLCRVFILWVPPGDVGPDVSNPPFPLAVLWVLLHVSCGERPLEGSSLHRWRPTGSCDTDVLLEGGLRPPLRRASWASPRLRVNKGPRAALIPVLSFPSPGSEACLFPVSCFSDMIPSNDSVPHL